MRAAMGAMGMGGMGGPPDDGPQNDTAEKVQISSLSLLKMLKHGKAGIPMEVMGLMLGEKVDDYTITCVDVFSMPQHGTGASVEAIDDVFQQKMLEMLKQTDRMESVVGWYHSHPGFGCWLSQVDINTQTSFEQLDKRCAAVVIDPVQSVKGKVVIDAFRLHPDGGGMMGMMMGGGLGGGEPRQSTSNIGHLKKPTIQARIHGLDKMYYQLVIDWRKNDVEEQMLMNLHKKNWSSGLVLPKIETHQTSTLALLDNMSKLSKDYARRVKEEDGKNEEELYLLSVGKVDPKKHLENAVYDLISLNILQCLGTMIDTVVF